MVIRIMKFPNRTIEKKKKYINFIISPSAEVPNVDFPKPHIIKTLKIRLLEDLNWLAEVFVICLHA